MRLCAVPVRCALSVESLTSTFCHAEFEEAKTRSCDKLGTKSITTILHFSSQVYN